MIYAKRIKIMDDVPRQKPVARDQPATRSKDVVCGCQYFDGAIAIVGAGGSTCDHKTARADQRTKAPIRRGVREHEYEPVIPMDTRKTPPPPFVKITADKEHTPMADPESTEIVQDKHLLCVPDKAEYEDSDDSDEDDEDDTSVEITAEELQHQIEERYFLNTPSSSKHDYELPDTRSISPSLTDEHGRSKSNNSIGLQDRMQLQADRIKQKFKNFKEQISKDKPECTPRMKRKNDAADTTQKPKPAKKNKFNFRRHTTKSNRSKFHLPTATDFHMPQALRLSLPRMPSFSRSRSSSVKERERKRSQSSETDSKKKFDFHFGTYPRFFNKKKKSPADKDEPSSPKKCKPKSEPSSPTQRRSPFPSRWISRFTEHKKEETAKSEKKQKQPETETETETIVKETIFISLHEDSKTQSGTTALETNKVEPEAAPTKMEIDNEKFIFISLHEERFPEKLQQTEAAEQTQQQQQEEQQIEKEIKADTASKFHSMLHRLQTDRKLKGRRTATADDKPQPVEITEITNDDCEDQDVVTNNIEIPDEEESSKPIAENVPPEYYSFESEQSPEKSAEAVKAEGTTKARSIPAEAAGLPVHTRETQQPPANDTPPARPAAPRKWPRKKLRKPGSDKESKESLSAFEDSEFTDAVLLDEQQQQPMTKTYIKASLQEVTVSVEPVEPEHTRRQFKEYEKALQSSRSFSSVEIENNFYSRHNSLAGLEAPVPPARPSRMYSLARKKKRDAPGAGGENKENYYDLDANANYNTFPIVKPDKPRRKFRKRRTYSNSTTNTEVKSIDDIEDDAINKNIVNAKQLSVSFLPLTSNVVGEPITDYNIRETSSMIHLNLADPPLPPKRKKERQRGGNPKYNSLPNGRYASRTSLTHSEVYNNSALNVDTELEYADDVNSTVPDSDTPPKRPCRRRNPSLVDEDRTSREVESLPSEKSVKDDMPFYDSDSKDGNGYAVIGASESRRESKAESEDSRSMPRRVSRRISDFFTLPRIRVPTNYVPSAPQTLDRRRLPSPSRPPRRSRPNREPVYTNEENATDTRSEINFEEEEQLNFNLATEDDQEEEDSKNLRTDDILEKMKSRPLPPPPRPLRKPKDDHKSDYSQCKKKLGTCENNLNQNVEEKIINTSEIHGTLRSTWSSRETRTVMSDFERTTREQSHETFTENGFPTHSSRSSIERREGSVHPDDDEKAKTDTRQRFQEIGAKNESTNECSNSNTRSESNNEISRRAFFNTNVFTQTSQSTEICPNENRDLTREPVNVITACKLNVSELNVGRLNINEIESSKLVASTVESSTLQVSDVRTETGNLVFNSIDCSECLSSPEQCQILEVTDLKESTPQKEIESTDTQSTRSRFSSMIPEVGSDEESGGTVTKAIRPSRRKQSAKRDEVAVQPTPPENNRPSLAELMCQILQICHSSIGQAIHSLLEQVIPEDREKRSEVQAAIWVITIIVAGCLMLGLQTNEKIVHHHHWDFHFPPPH